MSEKYLKVKRASKPRFGCILDKLTGLPKMRPLWRGEPLAVGFPSDVEFAMNPEFPDNTVLTDQLNNRSHLIIASDRLAEFFKRLGSPTIEFLPVTIRDHKGKIAAKYTIVHPLGVVDCLNEAASQAKRAPGSDTVMAVRSLVVIGDALDFSRPIIRVARFPDGLLVRSDIAAGIVKEGFSGIDFEEIVTS